MNDKNKIKSMIDAPISVLESIFEYTIDARKLRRIWFICFLCSVGALVACISMYFASDTLPGEYLVAFISLTAGLVSAFLIAWINEVSKEKERKRRTAKFRRYYIAKYNSAKTQKQKDEVVKQVEERNLFEEQVIFTEGELSGFDEMCKEKAE
jgi:hypothetical protein